MPLPAVAYVEIFPPIAVARVGDSPDYYFGPEVPDVEPVPTGGKFKDTNHKIKRQAARFRAFAFNQAGEPIFEIKEEGGFKLKWTVHVANKKGASVVFRGRNDPETWQLRNASTDPALKEWNWAPGVEKSYAFIEKRTPYIIDSGPTPVEGLNASPVELKGYFHKGFSTQAEVRLGEIRTDNFGRLVILAGDGHARDVRYPLDQPQDLTSGFNNDHWYDTTCDGSISLTVTRDGANVPVKHTATIITAPPRFTNTIEGPVTLYDAIENVYEIQKRFTDPDRKNRRAGYDCGEVQYYRHIDPLFVNMYHLSWTNKEANRGHGPLKANRLLNNESFYNPNSDDPAPRQEAFEKIRLPVIKDDPTNEAARKKRELMPMLTGDENTGSYLSLTELQYDRLKKWAKPEGLFKNDPLNYPATIDEFEDIKVRLSALTRAALQWSIGGALYPGIEVYWGAVPESAFQLDSPFRYNATIKPGDLTRGLSLPWQSDFNMCNTSWWPSIRPDNVVSEKYFLNIQSQFQNDKPKIAGKLTTREAWAQGFTNGNNDMVRRWRELGFVSRVPYNIGDSSLLDVFIETERSDSLPPRP